MQFPIAPGAKYGSWWKVAGRQGGFGADRGKGRLHAGCDIGAEHGTGVVAIEAGKVVGRANKPFIKGSPLFSITIKHTSGIVVRYSEINEIPTHLTRGVSVSQGESLGIVQQWGKKHMLHFELYKGTRKGYLSLPYAHWPRNTSGPRKGKRKRADEFSDADRRAITAAGYLPDYQRRDDLLDPTEFLVGLEKGTPAPDAGTLVALALMASASPITLAIGSILLAKHLRSISGTAPKDARAVAEPLDRDYDGPTFCASDRHRCMVAGDRDYDGPADVAWEADTE